MNIVEKRYTEASDKVYILELDVQYPENLQNLHYDLLSLSEIIKIKKTFFDLLYMTKLNMLYT